MQGKGRFDLPGTPGGVLYLSETPDHAVAESIQHYRNQALEDEDLFAAGHRLALSETRLPEDVRMGIVDLCDPARLLELKLRPDQLASGDRAATQGFAGMLHRAGHPGLRWWSALAGDWHTVVLFRDRLGSGPSFAAPEPLGIAHPALIGAARALGISLRG